MPRSGKEQHGKGRTSKVNQPIGDLQGLHALAFDQAVIGMALLAPDSTLLQANALFAIWRPAARGDAARRHRTKRASLAP
jgi:hypothetical protein